MTVAALCGVLLDGVELGNAESLARRPDALEELQGTRFHRSIEEVQNKPVSELGCQDLREQLGLVRGQLRDQFPFEISLGMYRKRSDQPRDGVFVVRLQQ